MNNFVDTKAQSFFLMKSFTYLFLWVLFSPVSAQVLHVKPPSPVGPLPSPQQLEWHKMELTAFVHFTTNTFTDKEWGYGDESETVFNPTSLNTEQWAEVLKDAGFKMIILTTKHHDGFCLWPSKYTEHSVKNSPYKNGKGDVVKETSDAAKKFGLKFGIYLSPWDRNHAHYGSEMYVQYYRNQLKELFTQYGPITEMWFDGANGGDGYYGGARNSRHIDRATYYEWPTTLKMVTAMEPRVLYFSDAGPNIRWVGNEKGRAGETNWNTLTPDTLYAGQSGIEGLLETGSEDGTRWIPAECDFSIRPGWFYHQAEDTKVKTPEQLFDIYLTSVGRGSNMLLNIPPDRRGLFHEKDVQALAGFKDILNTEFKTNLTNQATIEVSNTRGRSEQYSGNKLIDNNDKTYWATDDEVVASQIVINFKKAELVKYLVLQEYIALGQRIKNFKVEALEDGQWKEVAMGTTIGYKRILKIDPIKTQKIRIQILDAKASPVLSHLAVY